MNSLTIAQELISCQSVTPVDGGAMALLVKYLEQLGFHCEQLQFAEVNNLYARYGKSGGNFCFAGHTDVVPAGNLQAWSVPPFAGQVIDGKLFGRGAVDMKGAIACFIAAAARAIDEGKVTNSLSLLITGDEEGRAVNGTVKVLEWLENRHEKIDYCLVGEPTNPQTVGQMMKIGRRGSLSVRLQVNGVQGHIAYPRLADNPVTKLVMILHQLKNTRFDEGNEDFEPSNLEVTGVTTPPGANNMIPAYAVAEFNIRLNNLQQADALVSWIKEVCAGMTDSYELAIHSISDAFLTPPSAFRDLVAETINQVTGQAPTLSTSGGTSDARYIKRYAPVVEFGLVNKTAHKVDEHTLVSDIKILEEVYYQIICQVQKL